MVKLGEVNPIIWDQIVEIMERKLKSIDFQGDDILDDWRVNAASRKLERELFEQYGFLKDIILHPTFQYCKQLYNEYVDFRLFLGKAFIGFIREINLNLYFCS
jgi:hypothetical protein